MTRPIRQHYQTQPETTERGGLGEENDDKAPLTEARTLVLLLRTDIRKAKRRHAPTAALWRRLRRAVAELAAMEARNG